MGNKIITEKDFWMCTTGAMPAQLQGTRKSNKKDSGEVYITVADTATSSWIDFGCTKNMLFAALVAAVVAVVVVALIVGTGGIAAIGLVGMMAIGAGAGLAGGIVAAIDGALKCGQKNATARQWDGSKSNLIFTGIPAITGDRTMICKIGGTVKFAPEIKSWSQAIALGGFNYLTKAAECMLAGAAVGGGGYLASGLATGSLALAMPTAGSIASNVATSFTGIWGGSRALFGANSLANEAALGNVNSTGDALSTFGSGAVPEIGMGQRIATGQAHPSDYLLFLYFLNVKGRSNTPVREEPQTNNDKDGNTPKDSETTQPKEEGNANAKAQGADEAKPTANNKKGEAFEDGTTGDPPGTFRDANGKLRNSDGTYAKDPNAANTESADTYNRSMAERRKALLRDANDPNADLSDDARQLIKEKNGNNVPDEYEVSHEEPLYTRRTNEGKAELDVADNMKTQPKETHRARHRICGDQYHEFGPANKPKIIKD